MNLLQIFYLIGQRDSSINKFWRIFNTSILKARAFQFTKETLGDSHIIKFYSKLTNSVLQAGAWANLS